jgi:hypothetical protein
MKAINWIILSVIGYCCFILIYPLILNWDQIEFNITLNPDPHISSLFGLFFILIIIYAIRNKKNE